MFQKKNNPNILRVRLTLFFCLFAPLAFAADTTPPQGTISINSSALYTNSTAVTLSLSAADQESTVVEMQFSNNNARWSGPEPYSTTRTWTLSPYGDVTGDGQITIADALFIAQFRAGTRQLTPEQLSLADVNEDKTIDMVDALFIAQYASRTQS